MKAIAPVGESFCTFVESCNREPAAINMDGKIRLRRQLIPTQTSQNKENNQPNTLVRAYPHSVKSRMYFRTSGLVTNRLFDGELRQFHYRPALQRRLM